MNNPTSKPETQDTPFPTREDHPRQGEEALDNALEESFPASDPVSVTTDKPAPDKRPASDTPQPGNQHSDEANSGRKKPGDQHSAEHKEQTLDEGVEESFPASDPVSIDTKKTNDTAS
ncbi:MAG TPA: hypothetical protein VNQ97_05555 [Burkholderiaceae bacterium]|nr:hypothetical protein [Burkholderiaceae bacterium]